MKDYKIESETKNNPVKDSKKCMDLFTDIVNEFLKINKTNQNIFYFLLKDNYKFKSFFKYLENSK
ncbi:hypothetical protein HOG21_06420 [bacterium]|nr:hypothetical protein [bacterium]